jgi:hypothetical protein
MSLPDSVLQEQPNNGLLGFVNVLSNQLHFLLDFYSV